MTIFGIILARGGSKRLPRKNLLDLAGVPLLAHTIRACQGSQRLTDFSVSTEDAEIVQVAKEYGATVQQRPAHLADDNVSSFDVWKYVLHEYKRTNGVLPDILVNLNPTSPLRTSADIDKAIDLFLSDESDLLIGVTRVPYRLDKLHTLDKDSNIHFCWPLREKEMHISTMQSYPAYYINNGAMTIMASSHVLQSPDMAHFYTGSQRCIKGYPMPAERSVNIDTRLDFLLARAILEEDMGNRGE